jgi:hypothetical protein
MGGQCLHLGNEIKAQPGCGDGTVSIGPGGGTDAPNQSHNPSFVGGLDKPVATRVVEAATEAMDIRA